MKPYRVYGENSALMRGLRWVILAAVIFYLLVLAAIFITVVDVDASERGEQYQTGRGQWADGAVGSGLVQGFGSHYHQNKHRSPRYPGHCRRSPRL